jgi:hypothetical protein
MIQTNAAVSFGEEAGLAIVVALKQMLQGCLAGRGGPSGHINREM